MIAEETDVSEIRAPAAQVPAQPGDLMCLVAAGPTGNGFDIALPEFADGHQLTFICPSTGCTLTVEDCGFAERQWHPAASGQADPTQLAASPRNLSALTRNLGTTTYLFPGKTAGHHLTTKHLGNELARHGLDTRAARNTALITLAADLPAAVLAELFGLNVHTAERWTSYAKRDWTSYLAARDTVSPEEYRTP